MHKVAGVFTRRRLALMLGESGAIFISIFVAYIY